MINLVENEKPDVLMVSEANLEIDNTNLNVDFKFHNVETKFLGNARLTRIMVLINKDLTYERITSLETDDNAMII